MVVVTSPGGGRTLMRRLNRSRSWIIMGTMITVGVVAIALGIFGSVKSPAVESGGGSSGSTPAPPITAKSMGVADEPQPDPPAPASMGTKSGAKDSAIASIAMKQSPPTPPAQPQQTQPEPAASAGAAAAAPVKQQQKQQGSANNKLDPLIASLITPANASSSSSSAAAVAPAANKAAATAKPDQASVQTSPDRNICYADNVDQLQTANYDMSCSTIVLTGSEPYVLSDELLVMRPLTIVGSPGLPPLIDAQDAARAFRVMRSARLDVQYVQLRPSRGIKWGGSFRGRKEQAAGDGWRYREIRGGCVLFEPGSLGGSFVGVFFVKEGAVDEHVELQARGTEVNVFGEFVMMYTGRVDFMGCLFWDLMALRPMTDYMHYGGWVLVLGGTATVTGCAGFSLTLFGWQLGVGLNFGVLGGNLIMSGFNLLGANLAADITSVGEAFLTCGGTGIFTGVDVTQYSALLLMTGTAPFTTLLGVQVSTGVNNNQRMGAGAQFGAGLLWTVGAGVQVLIGATMIQNFGLYAQATAGQVSFLGAGTYVAVGSPLIQYAAIVAEYGAGGFVYVGAGGAWFTDCPVIDFVAIKHASGIGGHVAVSAGMMTWIGGPFIEGAAIASEATMLGSSLYVGGGALVLGGSPLIQFYSPLVTSSINFWVTGACEQEGPDAAASPVYIQPDNHMPWFSTATTVTCKKYIAMSGKGTRQLEGVSQEEQHEQHEQQVRALSEQQQEQRVAEEVKDERGASASLLFGGGMHQAGRPEWRDGGVRRYTTDVSAIWSVGGQTPSSHRGDLFIWESPKITAQDASALDGLHIDDSWKQRLADFASGLQELSVGADGMELIGGDQTDPPPVLLLESPPGGGCTICGLNGAVDGDGVSACDVSDECQQDFLAALQPPYNMTAESDVVYKPTIIVAARLEPVTRSGVNLTDATLQNAATDALTLLQMQADNADTIHLQVFNSTPMLPPSVWDKLQPPAPERSLLETGDFDQTHHFTLVAVTDSIPTGKLLQQWMGGEEGSLSSAMKELLAAQDVEAPTLGLQYTWSHTTPAYNPESMAGDAPVTSTGNNSVLLVDPDAPSGFLTQVEYGKKYRLHVSNWAPNSQVNIFINKMTSWGDILATLTITKIATDENGDGDVEFTFSRRQHQPGDYYFKAMSGLTMGQSPQYSLDGKPVARKLYGPSVWV